MLDLDPFPRHHLGHLPTPLEPMPRLAAALGGPHLYVKRDDCTGLATGGNKTRKLEFLAADAARAGADTLVTHGAVQSNHVRQTAAAAVKLGYRCHALLEERLADEPESYRHSGNAFLDGLFGAQLERRAAGSDMGAELDATVERLRAQGYSPYAIPGGGSNAVGALGYVDAMRELVGQLADAGLRADGIFLATGSSGTHAGMLAAQAALGDMTPLHGISVRDGAAAQRQKVYALACELCEKLGVPYVDRDAVTALDGYIGRGYGYPTDGMVEAVELTARTEGILLDPVYSGKAMAGMIDQIRRGRFSRDDTLVFLNTGGAVSLFAYDWAFAESGSLGSQAK